ncbi:hypothetical protein VTP01DRAFT_2504 [Rhizomucor pusillus]|uniref:uncharacterized protein n=1 Tax=Rhizomucor pusillus TaxID=4840 RepID=UPI003744161F
MQLDTPFKNDLLRFYSRSKRMWEQLLLTATMLGSKEEYARVIREKSSVQRLQSRLFIAQDVASVVSYKKGEGLLDSLVHKTDAK